MIRSIGVWGDSILRGVVLDQVELRYKRLQEGAVDMFAKLFPGEVKNHSRFGCTAPRAELSLQKALNNGDTQDLMLLEFGGNDCDFDWVKVSDNPDAPHQPNTPLNDYKKAIIQMIDSIKAAGKCPVVMTLPPIDANRFFDWVTSPDNVNANNVLRFLKEKQFIYRQQERYSMALERIAIDCKVKIIDVRSAFLEKRDLQNYLCDDGMHPNADGQKIIMDVFRASFSSQDFVMEN